MNLCIMRASSCMVQSLSLGGRPLNVYPDSDGTITWKGNWSGAYCDLSSERIGRNSRNEPGQPWKKATGAADGFVEKSATKWTECLRPSSSVTGRVKCGKELMWASWERLVIGQNDFLFEAPSVDLLICGGGV